MGVYIKGMEMPNNCQECACINDEYFYCQAVNRKPKDENVISRRPDWCPLIEVPLHGRLGDLDRLEQMFADIDNAPYSGFDGTEPFYSAEDAAQIIRLAPTIIEAEKGET